jgi:hypothetical protein
MHGPDAWSRQAKPSPMKATNSGSRLPKWWHSADAIGVHSDTRATKPNRDGFLIVGVLTALPERDSFGVGFMQEDTKAASTAALGR